jgi:pimeloyl-ACP methyl ester carboxylesterase
LEIEMSKDSDEQEGTPWLHGEPGPGNMKLIRQRDNQLWILDYLVKTTGRDRQFFYDGRRLPAGTRSYAMIPRQMARVAGHKEGLARAAEAKGHRETACRLYHKAALDYHMGQHALAYDDHPEKIYLHGKLIECFDKMIELSRHRIERFEVPFEGKSLPGLFYSCGKDKAPTVLHIPGLDSPKELYPDAIDNPYRERGFNIAIVDGPGQGESAFRKIRNSPDNFAPAMKAVLDHLVTRPDVDADRLGCIGFSMGTFWALQLASREPRLKAVGTAAGCYGPQYGFQQDSPHFKKQFMYMTGISDEEKFDRLAERYVLSDAELARIKCPVVILHGEYDPLNPLEDAYRVYDGIGGPKEFWLAENDAHSPGEYPHLGGLRAFDVLIDWMQDVFDGTLPPQGGQLKILKERAGLGLYGNPVDGFWMPERVRHF